MIMQNIKALWTTRPLSALSAALALTLALLPVHAHAETTGGFNSTIDSVPFSANGNVIMTLNDAAAQAPPTDAAASVVVPGSVDISGNLGIGTPPTGNRLELTAPINSNGTISGAALHIYTGAYSPTNNGGDIYFGGSGGDMNFNGGSDSLFDFANSGSIAGATIFMWSGDKTHAPQSNLYIANSGNVGIMTTPSSSYALDVNGSVRASAYYHNSDARLKTDIRPIGDALDKILAIKGVTFNWKDSGRPDMGVVAQNVAETFPNVVHKDNNGIMAVEYDSLVGPMIEAMRQLKAENDHMKAELADLHTQVQALKQHNAATQASAPGTVTGSTVIDH